MKLKQINLSIILIAYIAQLGERKTEDLKVAGSIPAVGIFYILVIFNLLMLQKRILN